MSSACIAEASNLATSDFVQRRIDMSEYCIGRHDHDVLEWTYVSTLVRDHPLYNSDGIQLFKSSSYDTPTYECV